MPRYTIHVDLGDSASQMKKEGWILYAFKAVQSASENGRPTVWYKYGDFLEGVDVEWEETYGTFIATGQEIPSGKITASTKRGIKLGQKMGVDVNGGVAITGDGDDPKAITVHSDANQLYTTGVDQKMVGGETATIAAFPLHGHTSVLMQPLEKVLLTFATSKVDVGTVKERAIADGVFIDLTEAPKCNLKYRLNQGWDIGKATNITKVEANADIVKMLVEKQERRQMA
ncbi:hypothetical protein [Streptomyces noursei]|uniref:hypothetical protein n=1 Tax=Streptomyces noursei TaxID=1971 RepID=UPI0023B8828C|nr:hypothetical protein [Streptomyces noursei]